MKLPNEITIQTDTMPEPKPVAMNHFITNSRKMLIDFGYPTITENEIKEQVQAILESGELNVIGVLLKAYIVLED